jgi:plastocyanin
VPRFDRLLPVAALLTSATAWAGGVSGTVKLPGGRSALDTAIYLMVPGKSYPAPSQPIVMDQRRLTFIPHVLVVEKGQTVEFPNNDIPRHNVFSASKAHPFNLGIYPPGATKKQTFEKAGVVALLCNMHPEMSAFLVVVDTPYHALTDAAGHWSIKDVPPGHYELIAWHDGMQELKMPIDVGADEGPRDLVMHKVVK